MWNLTSLIRGTIRRLFRARENGQVGSFAEKPESAAVSVEVSEQGTRIKWGAASSPPQPKLVALEATVIALGEQADVPPLGEDLVRLSFRRAAKLEMG